MHSTSYLAATDATEEAIARLHGVTGLEKCAMLSTVHFIKIIVMCVNLVRPVKLYCVISCS